MKRLGDVIKRERIRRGLSLRALGKLSKVSHTEIYRLEIGKRTKPSPMLLKSLARVLGMNYEGLMSIAGYLDDSKPSTIEVKNLLDLSELTEDEFEEVKTFADYLVSRRQKH